MSGSDATCPRDITGEQASDAEAGTDENNRLASREEVAASDAQAHFAQARRFWEQRDYESAERSIRRAISVDRTDPRFYRLAGRLYAKLGRIGEVRRCARRLADLGGLEAQALEEQTDILFAVLLATNGKINLALESVQERLESEAEPGNLRLLYYRGLFEQSLAYFEKAEHTFRRVLHLQPGHRSARRQLAIIHLDQGEYEGALSLLQELLREEPNPEVHFLISVAHLRMGSLNEAQSAAHTAVNLKPEEPKYRRQLGVILMRLGSIQEGRAQMHEADKAEQHSESYE